MNKVILAGRLARDPEVRYTQSGKAVATFSLAVSRRMSRNNAADGQPTADFIPIVVWDKLAEICGNNLVKGSQILVEGRMQVRSYDAQDGSKRYVTEVVGSAIEFMGSKVQRENSADSAFAASQPGLGASQPVPQGPGSFGAPVAEDDIPF